MVTWIYVDPANRIMAANYNSMAGNTSWFEADCDLPLEVTDPRGIPLFKFIEGVVLARTQEEVDADYVEPEAVVPEVTETDEAIIELAAITADNAALAAENAARLDEQDMALVELAALIAGGEI